MLFLRARAKSGRLVVDDPTDLPEGAEVRGIDEQLRSLGCEALVFRGRGPLWLGFHADFRIHEAVKHALDPLKRFPSLR